MSVETELYETLEISVTATTEEVKKAYRKKALQTHPDKGGSEEEFKKVSMAYEILSDPDKREIYNKHGKKGIEDDNSGNIDPNIIQEMFGNLFSRGFGGLFGNSQQRKNEPIVHHHNVSLEDLCTRKVVKLRCTRNIICKKCGTDIQCTECNGKGSKVEIVQINPFMCQQFAKKCGNCEGRGKVCKECGQCNKGYIVEGKTFELHLTPELENGYKYFFREEGNQLRGGEAGDFVVIINYSRHSLFVVNNRDLILRKEISLKDALCGHDSFVVHPCGEKIVINTIDKVIKPNTMMELLGKGMTSEGKLLVHFDIIFPETITEEKRNILSLLL